MQVGLERDFAIAVAGLTAPAGWALAVSGGPDSTALLHLAAVAQPVVLTVDHGLRADSASEAASVASAAVALGLRHETLRWEGHKPERGLQEAARKARYSLLGDACMRLGLGTLMTGHTMDDQLETAAMRAAKGSGAVGLAGMAAQSDLPDHPVRLVRPLLALRKAALVAHLTARGIGYVTDPSNSDARFDRVRLRQQDLAVDPAQIAKAQAARRRAEGRGLAFLAKDSMAGEAVLVSRAGFTALPLGVADLALSALLRRVGGLDHSGTRAERARVAAAIRSPDPFAGRTLAGTLIRPSRRRDGGVLGDRVAFERETGGIPARARYWLPFAQYPQIDADGVVRGPAEMPTTDTRL